MSLSRKRNTRFTFAQVDVPDDIAKTFSPSHLHRSTSEVDGVLLRARIKGVDDVTSCFVEKQLQSNGVINLSKKWSWAGRRIYSLREVYKFELIRKVKLLIKMNVNNNLQDHTRKLTTGRDAVEQTLQKLSRCKSGWLHKCSLILSIVIKYRYYQISQYQISQHCLRILGWSWVPLVPPPPPQPYQVLRPGQYAVRLFNDCGWILQKAGSLTSPALICANMRVSIWKLHRW